MIPHRQQSQHNNNDRQSYMKFSINYIQSYNNHLVFYQQEKNTKIDDLQIIVQIQTIMRIAGDNNRNGNDNRQIRNKVQSVRLASNNSNQNKRTIKENQQQSMIFFQSNNRWDCIKLDDSIVQQLLQNNNSIKCQLKLSYRIMKKNNNNNNKNQTSINSSLNFNNNNKKYIQLSQSQQKLQLKSSPQQSTSFPIDKLITQSPPYTINQLNVDIYLSTNKTQQQQNIATTTTTTTTKRQRDGTINLSIIYLPLIKPQIVFKDIKLTTKSFNNQGYKLSIKQLFSNQSDYYKDGENSSDINQTKQQNMLQQINLTLEPTNWQLYQHIQSKQTIISMPLVLNNNHDKIQFSLLANNNNSKGQNKKQNNKVQNINSINNQLISLKTLLIDTLYNSMGKSRSIVINKWAQCIVSFEDIKRVNNKVQKQMYQLRFMYYITMNLLLMNNYKSNQIRQSQCVQQQQQQEQPKQTNSKSLIQHQQRQQQQEEDVQKDGYQQQEDKSQLFLLLQSGFGNNK